MEHLVKLLRDSYDLQEERSEETAYWHLQKLRSEIKQLTLTSVVKCNCDKDITEDLYYDVVHLINDTYQVVGRQTQTVWKQGTMEECNDWVQL